MVSLQHHAVCAARSSRADRAVRAAVSIARQRVRTRSLSTGLQTTQAHCPIIAALALQPARALECTPVSRRVTGVSAPHSNQQEDRVSGMATEMSELAKGS